MKRQKMFNYHINKYFNSSINLLVIGFVVLFAVGLHFSMTISFQGNNIRVSLTDCLLPFAFLFIAFEMYSRKWTPALKIEYGWIWLITLTVWILVSFYVGVLYTGTILKWALVNKLIGWFILLFYFLCGLWLANNKYEIKKIFLISFIGTAFIVALYGLISYWLLLYNFNIPLFKRDVRIEAFVANPNAFGIMMACIFILQIPFVVNKELFKKKMHYVISSIILLSVYYSLSRSAWLGIIIGMLGLIIIRKNYWKPISVSIILCVSINIVIFKSPAYLSPTHAQSGGIVKPLKINSEGFELYMNEGVYRLLSERLSSIDGDNINSRVVMLKRALRYWIETPIIGIGIGGYKWKSKLAKEVKGGEYGYALHNSALWLLTETGFVGLLLFSTLFFLCFKKLMRREEKIDSISIGIAGILMVMLGASIGTEILYQRYLWFLLGLSLLKTPNYKNKN